MIVGVSGANSEIGRAVCEASRRKHEVVRLGRDGTSNRFLDVRKPLREDVAVGLDSVIHLAWDWDGMDGSRRDPNVLGGIALARACESAGARPVLLSTYSAFASDKSAYGSAKSLVERAFTTSGGASLRAGLIWGGRPAGIVATVLRLAGLPAVCVHLVPDPLLFHSNQLVLAERLVDLAGEGSSGVRLAAAKHPVALTHLVHAAQRSQVKAHVSVGVAPLMSGAHIFEQAGISLPFRIDSLRGVGPEAERAIMASDLEEVGGFPEAGELLDWIKSLSQSA